MEIKNIKQKQYEIIGRALDIYREQIDIDIDVKDFVNVALATIKAIESTN